MSVLASVLGGVIGAAGGGINGFLQGWQNLYNSKKLANYAYGLQKRGYEEFPTAQRKGLEAAGYNPMLALGSLGSATYSGGMPSGGAGMGDIVGGAKQGAELANKIEQGFKLQNEKLKTEINNIEADTDLKEGQLGVFDSQKAKAEAETAMLHSQTERSDLAYGRDIADTVIDIAGTGASLYSAKAMADVAKANAAVNARNATVNERRLDTHTTETHYDKKGNRTGSTERTSFSHGEPTERHSANPKAKPNATGKLGGSVKAAAKVAKEVGKLLLPTLPAVYATEVFVDDYKGKKRIPKHHELMYKNKPYSWSPLR